MIELTKLSGIYLLTAPNGLRYVGSATNMERRRLRHMGDLKSGVHSNQRLSRIYKKYGAGGFVFSVLEFVLDKSNLLEREQFYLDTIKPELNILKVAGSNLGVRWSDETKKKMSLVKVGKTHTKESREKMRIAKLGRKLSEKHKEKIGMAHKGRKWPQRTEKQKQENADRQRKISDSDFLQMVWLHGLNLSSREIGNAFGVCNTTAHRIVTGRKRAYKIDRTNTPVSANY